MYSQDIDQRLTDAVAVIEFAADLMLNDRPSRLQREEWAKLRAATATIQEIANALWAKSPDNIFS